MSDQTYPAAPWDMHGQLWLSLFRVAHAVDELRPAGVYGVALVRYEDPSPLTYGELLVAHTVKKPVKGVTITDIWVDSPASVAGGRELWAIPKGLCEFDHRDHGGRVAHTECSVTIDGAPVCSARFSDVSRLAPRVPFKGRTWQPELTEGLGAHDGEKTATLTGSSRTLPARGSWTFAADGPLAWLNGARQLGSARMADFEMSFG
ncbi:MAG TPA: acetoacetate decarboxylase family protein [Marmoricola sp.]